MSIPIISLDFFADPVPIHCPACGLPLYNKGEFLPGCRHLIFSAQTLPKNWMWFDRDAEARCLESLRNKNQKTAQQIGSSTEELFARTHIDSMVTAAREAVGSRSAFMLNLTTSDRGCGGMCQGSIYVIIDFNPS